MEMECKPVQEEDVDVERVVEYVDDAENVSEPLNNKDTDDETDCENVADDERLTDPV